MAGRLQGKIAVVSGGGGGFGAGIVDKFIAEGAKVVVLDLNEAAAQEKAASLPAGQAIAICGDVSTQTCWDHVLATAVSEFGGLDVVVNNAGVCFPGKKSTEVSEQEYSRTFDVNVKQIFWSTKVIIPYFTANTVSGLFINISSISSTRPRPNMVWYAASKSAVNNATKALAMEWAKNNIRFNAVCPSLGDTSMLAQFLEGPDGQSKRDQVLSTIPLGRMATPADIANACCYLASDEAAFITGVCLGVDGGRGI